jgi:hypothetical protein
MDLARAPRRAPLTARKKGSGYENGSRLAQTVPDYSTAIADSSPVVSVLLCLKRGRKQERWRVEAGKMQVAQRPSACAHRLRALATFPASARA